MIRRVSLVLFTIVLGMIFLSGCMEKETVKRDEGVSAAVEKEKVIDVNEIIKQIDPTKYTKAQIKEYYKSIRGKYAKGEGVVVNVLPGRRGRHRVTVLTSASKPEKGYNVVLYTTQDAPAELKLNDRISFEGTVGRISTFRGASVDIKGKYTKLEESK